MLRGGMSSVADLFISCMQDWLKLPSDCRINIPGTKDGNWSWRMLPYDASGGLAAKMRAMTKLFGR